MPFLYVNPWDDLEFLAKLGSGDTSPFRSSFPDDEARALAVIRGRQLLELITSPHDEVQDGLVNLWDVHQRLKAEPNTDPHGKRGTYSRETYLLEQKRKREGKSRLPG